jgi:hypothetical protein
MNAAIPSEIEARVRATHVEAAPLIARATSGDVVVCVEGMFSLLGARAPVCEMLRSYDFERQARVVEQLEGIRGVRVVSCLEDGSTVVALFLDGIPAAA